MAEQESIRSSRVDRAVSLLGAGAKVGVNYLKHYGRRSIGLETSRDTLDSANADDVYKTFSELKGGPLKLAQVLSIDRGLLPPAYAEKFSQAQYSAPPLSYPLVARTFQREFGCAPTDMFDEFSRQAAHGASIGQVHRASKNGHQYAVKVQYPGVADSLRSDLAIVKPIALQILGLRERDIAPYLAEVEARLAEETDYQLEIQRSIHLSESSRHIENVAFTRYHPEMSSKRILTMDWVEGVTLDKFADAEPSQALRDQVGQALWDFYHHQIHTLLIFHADPHPGNFLVRDGILHVIDFGCTKQLDQAFYRKHFQFLDESIAEDSERLEAALDDAAILLPTDTREQRDAFIEICSHSIRILAAPFRKEFFDFGDPSFMQSIYETGENNRRNDVLRSMRGSRGSAHSIYVNRAYFGLYALLARLRARVRTSLPEWIRARRSHASMPVAA